MWKNTVEPGRPEITIQIMPNASWIPKAKNSLIIIIFPRQQWLHEGASELG
jgi:hypothetical protein